MDISAFSLQCVFAVGRSYLPLAALGLETLSRWAHSLPPHVLHPHYPRLLPCLDAYLKTTATKPTGALPQVVCVHMLVGDLVGGTST